MAKERGDVNQTMLLLEVWNNMFTKVEKYAKIRICIFNTFFSLYNISSLTFWNIWRHSQSHLIHLTPYLQENDKPSSFAYNFYPVSLCLDFPVENGQNKLIRCREPRICIDLFIRRKQKIKIERGTGNRGGRGGSMLQKKKENKIVF